MRSTTHIYRYKNNYLQFHGNWRSKNLKVRRTKKGGQTTHSNDPSLLIFFKSNLPNLQKSPVFNFYFF